MSTSSSTWFQVRAILERVQQERTATVDLDGLTDMIVGSVAQSLNVDIPIPERPGRYEVATWSVSGFMSAGAVVVLRCREHGTVAQTLVPESPFPAVAVRSWADQESREHDREEHLLAAVCVRCGHAATDHRGQLGCVHPDGCRCELEESESVDPAWAVEPGRCMVCAHPVEEHREAGEGCMAQVPGGVCGCTLDPGKTGTGPGTVGPDPVWSEQ